MTTITTHNLGFPRIGLCRQLKFALEQYWRLEIDQASLLQTADYLKRQHWQIQRDSGLDFIPVGDFSFYDHVLDMSALLGAIPKRFNWTADKVDLDTYFRVARGTAPTGQPAYASKMTKWFDSNYHYIVPELTQDQNFSLASNAIFDEVTIAQQLGHRVKPVIIGPLTWLWLSKCASEDFNKLDLLSKLLPIYQQILQRFADQGLQWVQIDEPVLALDLPVVWRNAYERSYNSLQSCPIQIMLATYFGNLGINTSLACQLPVAGLHIDLVRAPTQLLAVLDHLATHKVLSLGIIDGRNIWRNNLEHSLTTLESVQTRFKGSLWIAPSCSLLHVPINLKIETQIDKTIRPWLAFATQKLSELEILRQGLVSGQEAIATDLIATNTALKDRQRSPLIHKPLVKQRVAMIDDVLHTRASSFTERNKKQRQQIDLPLYPTTTIGSLPQTPEIRKSRRDFKQGLLSTEDYRALMHGFIEHAISEQEKLGLDVLVHGEPERNDMVEYFGEQLDGFIFSDYGWVQSYGSRCVKPPIIVGDISRSKAMTVDWIKYAQSLTHKPVKGMLTGPVTLLNWSFVRDDQARSETALQLALALRDEVLDLQDAGIKIIQIDEAALREGLPLRKQDWQGYLDWAIRAFQITAGGVDDDTQIHTHMCYSEFNDIIQAIAAMDADVITIETSRSKRGLLAAFENFDYPNDIGPGVYDIHSPNCPSVEQMVDLVNKASQHIPAERLWINPDCGLKTRNWEEVSMALTNMTAAAKILRA